MLYSYGLRSMSMDDVNNSFVKSRSEITLCLCKEARVIRKSRNGS